MRFIHIIYFCLGVAIAEVMGDPKQQEQCKCAVFENDKPALEAKPLTTKIPEKAINCTDPKAKDDCKNLCNSLDLVGKEDTQKVLCKATKGHIHNLKPAVFFQDCANKQWQYTGVSAKKPFCCHDGVPIVCEGGTTARP